MVVPLQLLDLARKVRLAALNIVSYLRDRHVVVQLLGLLPV